MSAPNAVRGHGDADVDHDVDGAALEVWAAQFGAPGPIAAALFASADSPLADHTAPATVLSDELIDTAMDALFAEETGSLQPRPLYKPPVVHWRRSALSFATSDAAEAQSSEVVDWWDEDAAEDNGRAHSQFSDGAQQRAFR
jgi:hypothetical protein